MTWVKKSYIGQKYHSISKFIVGCINKFEICSLSMCLIQISISNAHLYFSGVWSGVTLTYTKHTCWKEIWLHAQKLVTISDIIVNMIEGGGYMIIYGLGESSLNNREWNSYELQYSQGMWLHAWFGFYWHLSNIGLSPSPTLWHVELYFRIPQ